MKELLFAFLLLCLPVQAATYYVSTTGSNSNACSTIDSAGTNKRFAGGSTGGVSCLSAGDTLYIHAGTYQDGINSTVITVPGGTSWSVPITIAAYPGEIVTLAPIGGNEVIGMASTSQKYIIFDRLIIDGINTGVDVLVSIGSGANHVRFTNCEIKNNSHGQLVQIGPIGDFNEFIGGSFHDAVGNNNNIPPGGYGFYISSKDNLIDGVTIYNTTGYGIHEYVNTTDHPGAHADRNTIRNCTIHDLAINASYPSTTGILIGSGDDNLAYNNLVYSLVGGGIASGGTSSGPNPVNNRIYDNTIYNTTQHGISVANPSTNAIIRNNIVYLTLGINDTGTGTTKDHNLCDSAGSGCTVIGNPVFADATGHDFHILAGSPAKDAGATLTEVTLDFDGFTRPQGAAYDIGAYEYVANIPPPLSTIAVTSPNGGENLVVGSAFPIKWTSNDTHTVKIEASRDGGLSYSEIIVTGLAQTADSANSYSWTPTAPQSYTAKIRVTNLNDSVADESNAVCSIRGSYIK